MIEKSEENKTNNGMIEMGTDVDRLRLDEKQKQVHRNY